jgi:probable HAF family extracellular repeat protein
MRMQTVTAVGTGLWMALAGVSAALAATPGAAPATGRVTRPLNTAPVFAPDLVSAVSTGAGMNDAGDIIGRAYQDTGCGPFCLPPQDTVVWKNGVRIVLPALPGRSGASVTGINRQGWISGYAGSYDFPRAVLWKPQGEGYEVIDLGTLPGANMHSAATGIDDLGRVVGWSSPANLPPGGVFMWTEAGGMVDLSQQGFPAESPAGISPGGTVATFGHWYRLGEPGSVTALAPVPPGGWFQSAGPVAINDAGDQARALAIGLEHPFSYIFRYHHQGGGTWQQVDFSGTGPQSRGGIGSIDAALDITSTVSGSAQIAFGPSGTNQALDGLLSPAYRGPVVAGGTMNASGQILAQLWVGQAGRLARLTPVSPCLSDCIRVSSVKLNAVFHQDPKDPGHCSPGNAKEFNSVQARIKVTSETGARLPGVVVTGRFMDQYWKNTVVSGTSNAKGVVKLSLKGPCGVGTESFIIDNASLASRVFDKTVGVLDASALPR